MLKGWLMCCCLAGIVILAHNANIVEKFSLEATQEVLSVSFKSGVSANLGEELTPTQVKDKPIVEWQNEADAFYTLIFSDPDVPSRADPSLGEFLHWLVVNIPGKDVSQGEVLAQYVGSGTPKGTGLHNYVLVVYKQPGKLNFDEPRLNNTSVAGRFMFSSASFAKKYELGAPIAYNYFQAQWDEYVITLHRQLGADV